jgi:hypothetical protein
MKKLIVLLLLVSCSSESVQVEEPLVTLENTTSTSTTTTTLAPEDDVELMDENFHRYWREHRLKVWDIKGLSVEERQISDELMSSFSTDDRDTASDPNYFYTEKNNPFSIVVVYELNDTQEGEFIVCTKHKGTSATGLLDEEHPIHGTEGGGLPYVAPSTYACNDDEMDFLFGYPFYQDEQWWIFKTMPQSEMWSDEDLCEDPCGSSYQRWATRTEFRPIRGTFYDDNGEQIEFLQDFSDKYENIAYEVDYEYVDFPIFYPKINFNDTCADFMEKDILSVIEVAVEDRIYTVDNYRDSDSMSEEEKELAWDYLSLTYDVVEINDELVSIMYRWNSYSFGAAHSQDWYFSRSYIIDSDEDGTECFKVDIQEEMGGTYDYERGVDFSPKIYEWIYQQLCLDNDNTYFGCEDTGWVDIVERENDDIYLYKLHLFEDLSGVQFAYSRLGLMIQFQNYSIGSYADGAPRIIIPNTNNAIYSNDYRLNWIIKDMMCYQDKDKPTVYEPQFIKKALCTYKSI